MVFYLFILLGLESGAIKAKGRLLKRVPMRAKLYQEFSAVIHETHLILISFRECWRPDFSPNVVNPVNITAASFMKVGG